MNIIASDVKIPLEQIGNSPLEWFDEGIACQLPRVLENNAASSSLQTFDFLLILKTTAVPDDVTVLQKR